MTEHESRRVLTAARDTVFALVADPGRLPDWLPTVEQARPALAGDGTEVVTVEGDAEAGHYRSNGFWRPEAAQLRVEWGNAAREGGPSSYSGWLEVADRSGGGCEITVHLSFAGDEPAGVDEDLERALDALAGLVER